MHLLLRIQGGAHPRADADIGRSEDWHLVRPAYWWRQRRPDLQRPSRRVASSSGSFSPPGRRAFVRFRDRECHRCLLKGHMKIECRNPFTCFRCRQIGHRARNSTNPPTTSPPPPPPTASPATTVQRPPSSSSARVCTGGPSLRPAGPIPRSQLASGGVNSIKLPLFVLWFQKTTENLFVTDNYYFWCRLF
ncbi:hypothetical protein VPH35_131122 [Triticum aestivum]